MDGLKEVSSDPKSLKKRTKNTKNTKNRVELREALFGYSEKTVYLMALRVGSVERSEYGLGKRYGL